MALLVATHRVMWICLATWFVLCSAAPNCEDQDEAMRVLTQEQLGKAMSCAETHKATESACSDGSFAKICCAVCEGGIAARQLQEEVSRQLAAAPSFFLRTGLKMPPIALGTSVLLGDNCVTAVEYALRVGYRALDTALFYNNHQAVGKGIRESGLPREDIFLISKIPPSQGGYGRAANAVKQMLTELGTPYLDLCLIHYPGARFSFEDERVNPHATTDAAVVVERAGTWRELEQAYRDGYCRNIGVSNYLRNHLEELLDYAVVPPAVNQIEYHPYFLDSDTLRLCRRYHIVIQAYGSINARGLLDDPVVATVANEVGRSAAQVLLRWALQEGVMVLPKSGNKQRIVSNAQLWDFSLTPRQQQSISALDRKERFYLKPEAVPAGRYNTRRHWSKWRFHRNTTGR